MYKEGKSPWQLAKEKKPGLTQKVLMLPPIDLDICIKNFASGGYYLLSNPSPFSPKNRDWKR